MCSISASASRARDEEFGEERLIATVESAQTLAPAAVIAHIMAATDAFGDGAPQSDDMTLVVACCTIGLRASGSGLQA